MSQNESPRSLSPEQRDQLHHLACQVAENAYAPYSQFRVGAILLLENGKTLAGCNVENASYRLTICAEQSAIASAVALYGPSIRIRALIIANLNHAASPPCGACRQTIQEFSTPQTEIFFPAADGSLVHSTATDLLPYAFILNEPSSSSPE